MTQIEKSTHEQTERELVFTRVFDAPRDLVFQVWTQPEHIEQWWGPKGLTTRVDELDLRPGGAWRYAMCGPDATCADDGVEHPVSGTFREVVPPERIVTVENWGAEGSENRLNGMIVTVTFEEVGSQTKVALRIEYRSESDCQTHKDLGALEGWTSLLDCLEGHLAQTRS